MVPQLATRAAPGRWFAGDLHVHATGASNDTGGDSHPAEIMRVARARDLDFIVLTDHSNSTGSDPDTLDEDPDLFNQGPEFTHWDEAAELSNTSFLMMVGNEISPVSEDMREPTGHIGCLPRPGPTFRRDIEFSDRPRGQVTGGEALAQAREAGCYTVLNHPFGIAPWIAYDWTSRDYDAIEVWNGGLNFDVADEDALKAWACDLSLGGRPALVGGSDNHRVHIEPPGQLLDPALGEPTTWIWAEALEQASLMSGLQGGHTSVSDTGTPLELDIFDQDGAWLAMQGDSFDGTRGRWLRLRGEAANTSEPRSLVIYEIIPDTCQDAREPGRIIAPMPGWRVLYEESVTTGDIEVIRPIRGQRGHAIFGGIIPTGAVSSQHLGVSLSGAVYAE